MEWETLSVQPWPSRPASMSPTLPDFSHSKSTPPPWGCHCHAGINRTSSSATSTHAPSPSTNVTRLAHPGAHNLHYPARPESDVLQPANQSVRHPSSPVSLSSPCSSYCAAWLCPSRLALAASSSAPEMANLAPCDLITLSTSSSMADRTAAALALAARVRRACAKREECGGQGGAVSNPWRGG